MARGTGPARLVLAGDVKATSVVIGANSIRTRVQGCPPSRALRRSAIDLQPGCMVIATQFPQAKLLRRRIHAARPEPLDLCRQHPDLTIEPVLPVDELGSGRLSSAEHGRSVGGDCHSCGT